MTSPEEDWSPLGQGDIGDIEFDEKPQSPVNGESGGILGKSPSDLGWHEVKHPKRRKRHDPRDEGGGGDPSGSGPRCCPEYFKYTKSWYRIWRFSERSIGVHFNADAKFSPKGGGRRAEVKKEGQAGGKAEKEGESEAKSKSKCNCLCCRFQQYVQLETSGSSGGAAFVEDCVWVKEGKSYRSVVDDMPPKDAELVVCVGDRPALDESGRPEDIEELELLRRGVGTVHEGPCRIYFTDEPGLKFGKGPIRPGAKHKGKYVGVVTDVCRNDIILAYSSFDLDIRVLPPSEQSSVIAEPWRWFNNDFLKYGAKYGIAQQGPRKEDKIAFDGYEGGEFPS